LRPSVAGSHHCHTTNARGVQSDLSGRLREKSLQASGREAGGVFKTGGPRVAFHHLADPGTTLLFAELPSVKQAPVGALSDASASQNILIRRLPPFNRTHESPGYTCPDNTDSRGGASSPRLRISTAPIVGPVLQAAFFFFVRCCQPNVTTQYLRNAFKVDFRNIGLQAQLRYRGSYDGRVLVSACGDFPNSTCASTILSRRDACTHASSHSRFA